MTQTELAEAIGVNLSTVGNWERLVTCPDAEQVWNCAVALGCTPNDILGWYEDHPREDSNERLTSEEREIVGCYRDSTPQWQNQILMSARGSAIASKKDGEHSVSATEERAAV